MGAVDWRNLRRLAAELNPYFQVLTGVSGCIFLCRWSRKSRSVAPVAPPPTWRSCRRQAPKRRRVLYRIMNVNIALSRYGGRQEVIDACRSLSSSQVLARTSQRRPLTSPKRFDTEGLARNPLRRRLAQYRSRHPHGAANRVYPVFFSRTPLLPSTPSLTHRGPKIFLSIVSCLCATSRIIARFGAPTNRLPNAVQKPARFARQKCKNIRQMSPTPRIVYFLCYPY